MEEIYQQVGLQLLGFIIIDMFRYLIPSLFSEEEMKDMFLVNHQEFFELRDQYVRPYLATLGPYIYFQQTYQKTRINCKIDYRYDTPTEIKVRKKFKSWQFNYIQNMLVRKDIKLLRGFCVR